MWKFNRYDWKQERNLVITNAGIYNLKKKSNLYIYIYIYIKLIFICLTSQILKFSLGVKRRITISKIAGITKSKDAKSL